MTYRFVFEARVRPGYSEEQYIEAWRAGSLVIQGQPGALGTHLHRSEPGILVAIASWESRDARDAAAVELGFADITTRDLNSVVHQHLMFAEVSRMFGLDEVAVVRSRSTPR